jgi:hypothetical protein
MFCSKCGAVVTDRQAFCAKCGHTTRSAAGTQAAEQAEVQRFQRTIRRLSRYFYFFSGVSGVLGIMGLFAIQTGLSMHAGPWEPWPHPYIWNWSLTGSMAWTLLVLRIAAALAAGWGLDRKTDWSRPVALIAAGVAFLEFPIGFALAIYAFSVLLGRHHAQLYAQLGANEMNLVPR